MIMMMTMMMMMVMMMMMMIHLLLTSKRVTRAQPMSPSPLSRHCNSALQEMYSAMHCKFRTTQPSAVSEAVQCSVFPFDRISSLWAGSTSASWATHTFLFSFSNSYYFKILLLFSLSNAYFKRTSLKSNPPF